MTRLFARYMLALRGCVVVRQGRYSFYRAYKAAVEKEGECRRAAGHCADAYFAWPARGDGGGRTFMGHGAVRVLVNNLCVSRAGNLRPGRVVAIFVQRRGVPYRRAPRRVASSSEKLHCTVGKAIKKN